MTNLREAAILHAMPNVTIRSGEPNVGSKTGDVVPVPPMSTDAETQCARPVRQFAFPFTVGKVQRKALAVAVVDHRLPVVLGAAVEANLAAVSVSSVAGADR